MNDVSNYSAGAVTALANMAALGANKKDVFEVAEIMDISFDNIDKSDYELLIRRLLGEKRESWPCIKDVISSGCGDIGYKFFP